MEMTQMLLKALKRDWQTPVSALNDANCFSLSQRCGELVKAGYTVEKKWVALPSGKRVMSYRIVE